LECIRRWVRVAWVCRVSVISCIAGFILLALVAQGRDLFLEFPGQSYDEAAWYEAWPWMLLYASYFGFLVFLFWALPVHATARLALQRKEWLSSPYSPRCDPRDPGAARAAFETPGVLLPRILGVLCFVGPAVGAIYAAYEILEGPSRATRPAAAMASILYVVSLTVFCILFLWIAIQRRQWLRSAVARWRTPNQALTPPRPSVGRGREEAGFIGTLDLTVVTALSVFLVIVLAVPYLLNIAFPRLFLVPVLLGAWVPLLGWLGRWSFATRIPLITAAIAVVVAFSYFVGDNHDVMVKARSYRGQIDLETAVRRWRQANDCDGDRRSCPSPVIVATAGGADRAAYMTASALGLLLDATCFDDDHRKPAGAPVSSRCKEPPLFGRRLFAISGVSGGSLGAVVYARAYYDGGGTNHEFKPPCQAKNPSRLWFGHGPPKRWRDCLPTILAEDFLSPVFAGLGFRDVFSSFGKLIDKVNPSAWPDRGQLLETSWITGYNRFVDPGNRAAAEGAGLAAPFTDLRPDESGPSDWRPLLLLNATSVETGRRIITSHVAPTYASKGSCSKKAKSASCVRLFTDAYDMHDLLNRASNVSACDAEAYRANQELTDLSLAAAAGNSARFPVVSPAGNIRSASNRELRGRVVDGGYFDNYGALTAFDLVDSLRWEYDLYPMVILITNDPGDNEDPTVSKTIAEKPSSLPPALIKSSEKLFASVVAAPVDTFFNVRSGHGSTALKLLRELIDPEVYQKEPCEGEQKATQVPADTPTGLSCYDLFNGNAGAGESLGEPCFAHLGVYPQATDAGIVKDISMSWWLSKPVQNYLDSQLRKPWEPSKNEKNLKALELICRVVTLGVDFGGDRRLGSAGADSPRDACLRHVNAPVQSDRSAGP
jgi:hypothetical protein